MPVCVSAVFDWESHSPEWRSNIVQACQSWTKLGFDVVYVSSPISDLAGPQVSFIGDERFAPVYRLLEVAAQQRSLTCLLDADLRLGPGLFKAAHHLTFNARMLTSRRWTLGEQGEKDAAVEANDHAVDFFMTDMPSLFVEPAKLMPRTCRVGHTLWDYWLVGYFNTILGERIRHATKYRFVFHPRHAERNMPYGQAFDADDEYSKAGKQHPKEL